MTSTTFDIHDELARDLGDPARPLLLAVRVGEIEVRFLGVTDVVVARLASSVELEDAAWDAYRTFLETFGRDVLGIQPETFASELRAIKVARGMVNDLEATDDDWKEVVYRYKQIWRAHGFESLLDDPAAQLQVIFAVAAEAGVAPDVQVMNLSSGAS